MRTQLAVIAILALSGCASPLADKADHDLRQAVRQSAQRELAEPRELPQVIHLEREDRVPQLRIKPEILDQLEQMAGPNSYSDRELPLGEDLYNHAQKVVRITLERAITSNVQRNLNVEFARLAPAISQQQYVAADAAFDWVVFSNAQYNWTHEPRVDSTSSGIFTNINTDKREVTDITTGLRKPLVSGGQLTVQTEFQNTLVKTPGLSSLPNPGREANIVIQLDQPLLRGFGSDVTLAQVRLARNAELDSIAQLKSTLLTNIRDTEGAYWDLVRARWDLEILQRLLERGEEVLRILRNRLNFDVKPATISNAAAAVESRRADVIRGQRVLRDASEKLKVLMNDPEFLIGDETMLLPADGPVDQAVDFDLFDALKTTLDHRPEMQRALLSLDGTSIRLGVADNARLPKLDMRALTRFSGLGNRVSSPYNQIGGGDFIDYQIGLVFEQPLGNRAAEAVYRQRRLEREQAVIAMRNTVQGLVAELKSALRDVQTNYRLVGQTKAARIAAAEDLRTLQVEEDTIGTLSPEFLNLKLQRQQALAAAEQGEITSLVDFNTSMSRVYTAMGTSLERNRIKFDAPPVRLDRTSSDLFPDYPLEPRRPSEDEIKQK